jgi:hypothetical protein
VRIRVKVFVDEPRVAEIDTGVEADTATVPTLKVVVFAPEETVTVEGTVAMDRLLLVSGTEMPSLGATPFSFTVPVQVAPPTTVLGLIDSKLNAGAATVKVVDSTESPLLAVMVTGVEDATGMVITLKVTLVAPAGTVMLEGTAATEGLLETRDTAIPLA